MHTIKFWPLAHSLGRSLAGNRGELVQQGIKTYNTTNYQTFSPWDHHFHRDYNKKRYEYHLPWRLGFYKNSFYRHISGNALHKFENSSKQENESAHSILCSLPAYKFTTVNSEQCLSSLTSSNSTVPGTESTDHTALVNQFVKVSINLSQASNGNGNSNSQLCLEISNVVPVLPFNQLIKVLSAMTYWTTAHSQNKYYGHLVKSVSAIGMNSFHNCTPQELLLAGDCFYSLGVSGPVFSALTRTLARLVPTLKPAEIVQYIFYTNLNRSRIISQDILEKRIVDEIDSFSPDELGIIAMGMFKTQSPIHSPQILERMINALKDVDKLSSTSIGSLLKAIRYSLKFDDRENAYKALDNLSGKLDGMHILALSQVLLFAAVRQTFQPQVIDKATDLMLTNLDKCRLKDIEKLLQALLIFKFDSQRLPYVYERILIELCSETRKPELDKFSLSFLSCLVQLTSANWYPHVLLSAVFEPSVAKFSIDNGEARKLFFLHWNVAVEGPPNYAGHRLARSLVSELTQKHMCRIPTQDDKKLTKSERQLLRVQEKLDMFLGKSSSRIVLVLPHAQLPEIVFCTNHLGDPIDIPEEYFQQSNLGIKRPIGKDVIYNAVMVFGLNQMIFPKEHGMTGRAACLHRQLKHLGYKVALIGPHYFNRSNKSKFTLLEELLNDMTSLSSSGKSFQAFLDFTDKNKKKGDVTPLFSNP